MTVFFFGEGGVQFFSLVGSIFLGRGGGLHPYFFVFCFFCFSPKRYIFFGGGRGGGFEFQSFRVFELPSYRVYKGRREGGPMRGLELIL